MDKLNYQGYCLFIFLGVIPGALLRWQLNNHLVVNVIGAAIFGFLVGYRVNYLLRVIFGAGFCGAFTTFSSWIIQAFRLWISGFYSKAILLIFFTLILGLLASMIGFWFGKKIKSSELV